MSSSAHVVRVKRLYRQGLKCLQNWAVHRDLFISKGFEMRAEFEAHRHVSNPSIVEKLVSDGEAKLVTYAHPAPYTRAPAPAHRTQAPHPLREPPRAHAFLSCLSSDHARRHQVPATPKQRPGMEPGGAQPLIAAPRHLPVLGPPARPEAGRVAPRRPFPWPAFPCGPPSCPHADPRPPPRAASCAPFRATSSERAASVAYLLFGRLRGAASPHPSPPDVGYVCYLWSAKMGQHQCLRFYTGDAEVSRVYPHSLESRVV